MKKLFRLPALVAVLTACMASVHAQQPAKVPRIGYLSASDPASHAYRLEAFRLGLRELGYVEGRNVILEYRWAHGKGDRLPALASELEALKVNAIVTGGPSATYGAKRGTARTAIVMAFDSDPVGSGFVASLARPGGNITGLSFLAPEVSGKQLDLLKQILPKFSRVVILGDSKEPANARSLQEAERAATMLGVQVQYVDRRTAKDSEDIFQAARRENADALVVLVTSASSMERARLVALAAKYRLPAVYPWPAFVDDGGLMTYSVKVQDLYRRAATYVDRILKGSKPGELPVELPSTFDLVINLRAAKQIGLTIPASVLARADRVIE